MVESGSNLNSQKKTTEVGLRQKFFLYIFRFFFQSVENTQLSFDLEILSNYLIKKGIIHLVREQEFLKTNIFNSLIRTCM